MAVIQCKPVVQLQSLVRISLSQYLFEPFGPGYGNGSTCDRTHRPTAGSSVAAGIQSSPPEISDYPDTHEHQSIGSAGEHARCWRHRLSEILGLRRPRSSAILGFPALAGFQPVHRIADNTTCCCCDVGF